MMKKKKRKKMKQRENTNAKSSTLNLDLTSTDVWSTTYLFPSFLHADRDVLMLDDGGDGRPGALSFNFIALIHIFFFPQI